MSDQQPQQPSQRVNISGSVLQGVQIGGIAGNDLNLTQIQGKVGSINIFSPVQIDQTSIGNTKSINKNEYRWRQVLLNKVKKFWIDGVLKRSLHANVLIELGLTERNELVQNPLNEVFSSVSDSDSDSEQVFPPGTVVSDVFEEIGLGRTLLILGEPGAGKTVTLLKLAEGLIARSENDLSQPLPVVMNLSSWAKQRTSIAGWLVQELRNVYGASKALSQTWVEQEQLILLLDGLDEVDARYRNNCVTALNQFIQDHGLTEIIVCSRLQDYEVLSERLKLRSAIYVRPLTTQQINYFLENAGKSLAALRSAIKQNTELQELTSSPLMLSIVSLAYQNCAMAALPQIGSSESQRKQLLDTYIDRMFMRRGTTQQYSKEQTLYWLIFLGKRMVNTSQSIFLIEQIQPTWFQTQVRRIRYRLGTGLFVGVIFGLFGGLYSGLKVGLFGGIFGGLINMLFGGLIFISIGRDIEPVESLKWSWKSARKACYPGAFFGLITGLFLLLIGIPLGVLSGVLSENLNFTLIESLHALLIVILFTVLPGGLIGGLIGGMRGPDIEQRVKTNQGIWKSTKHALVLILIGGLTGGLIGGLSERLIIGLIDGLFYGLYAGLVVGGSASIRHFILRLMLYRTGCIPWNYARFLDYAADRLFLQKVGGGYIFIHRMLLEHFAQMEHPS